MSKADFVVSPELSYKLAPGHLGSADTLIRSRKQVEVKPQSSETIELYPAPTSRTEFVLNAHSGWMDNSKSHLEFEVACYAADTAHAKVLRALCTGGGHALIRNISVVDGSGTEIDNVPEYAKLYGVMSNNTQSPEHVEKCGMFCGDSVQPYSIQSSSYEIGEGNKYRNTVNRDGALDVTYANAGPTLTLNSGTFYEWLSVGDRLVIHHSAGTDLGIVLTINDARTVVTLSVALGGARTGITGIYYDNDSSNEIMPSTRRYVATRNTNDITSATTAVSTGGWVKLQLKLAIPFLQQEEYIPLLFIPNMRIIIEWNPAWMCLMVGQRALTGAKKFGVRIQNPRYIMSIVEPVEQVIADWHARYMSDQGLIYHFVSYYNHRKWFQSLSNDSWVVPCTFVSARAAISAIYPSSCFVQSDTTVQNGTTGVSDSFSIDKTGTFILAKMDEYEFVVGSDRYPLDGRVKCDFLGGENLLHNLKTLGAADSKDLKLRFSPIELRAIHPTDQDLQYGCSFGGSTQNAYEESIKTIFTADLTKEGELSGVSLRNQDLQPMFYHSSQSLFTNGGSYTTNSNVGVYILTWVPHDRVVRVSKADGGVRVFD
jgi:hypothetical protein